MIKLENKELAVSFDPDFGCKIHSFLHKETGFDLAAKDETGKKIKEISFGDYAFGMDDAFPNIDKEKLSFNEKDYSYLDHGMVWNRKFKVMDVNQTSAVCAFKDKDLKLTYTKILSLKGDTLHSEVLIDYEGDTPFPCIWTFHGLVKYEDGMEVILPKGNKLVNVFKHPVLGDVGNILENEKEKYVTSALPKKGSGDMLKYYVFGPVSEGHCGLRYKESGMEYELKFNKEALPYLGVWITAGGLDGANNMALEPSDGFYDSVSKAIKNKAIKILNPNEKRLIEFDIRLKRIPEGKNE